MFNSFSNRPDTHKKWSVRLFLLNQKDYSIFEGLVNHSLSNETFCKMQAVVLYSKNAISYPIKFDRGQKKIC